MPAPFRTLILLLLPIGVCSISSAHSHSGGAQTIPAQPQSPWQHQPSGTASSLRGIHAAGKGIAWASGANGTVLRTEDGGYEWQRCAVPPGGSTLDFRGIWGWDSQNAIVMSSGPGNQSRLYRTRNGCVSWDLLMTNPDPQGFWDAVAAWDSKHWLILGDPVPASPGSRSPERLDFVLLETRDGGRTWKRLSGSGDYFALRVPPGAAIFAASNSALFLLRNRVWFGAGGGQNAIYRAGRDGRGKAGVDRDLRFQKAVAPLASGTDSSGVFSLAFRDAMHGVAVGGDYRKPGDSSGTAAYTSDGGKHWTAARRPPRGYRSAVAWDAPEKAWIAAGSTGSDLSYDDGRSWKALDDNAWNALSLPWAVGPKGEIGRLGPFAPRPHRQAGSR